MALGSAGGSDGRDDDGDGGLDPAGREHPEAADDNGWRIFSGEEDQAYADDASNSSLYNASTLVGFDPDIAPLLALKAPVAFERGPDGGFVRIEDEGGRG